jgi:hypothetical protein
LFSVKIEGLRRSSSLRLFCDPPYQHEAITRRFIKAFG